MDTGHGRVEIFFNRKLQSLVAIFLAIGKNCKNKKFCNINV